MNRITEDNLSSVDLQDLHDWSQDLRSFWRLVYDVRRLLPDEIWKRYEDFGLDDMAEQVLLRENQKPLRACWKARPKVRVKQ